MAKGFAINNSMTNHGGIIQATQQRTSQMGNLFLRAGDGHFCPKCKCWSTIQPSHNHIIMDGKPVAYTGDRLTCGATIQPKQSHVVGTSQGENYKGSTTPIHNTTIQQNDLVNNFNGNNERYENQYTEQNRTDIFIKFKTVLPPYDSDGKGFSILHSLSGVISFLLNYTLAGTRLFISLSAYTDPLSRNAKVLPYATAYISRDGNQIATKKIDDTDGIWNTEKGKVPVGSAVIELPKSNLSIVTVELKLGYFAQVNDSVGQIAPIPPTTSYSFTLTSIAKRIS